MLLEKAFKTIVGQYVMVFITIQNFVNFTNLIKSDEENHRAEKKLDSQQVSLSEVSYLILFFTFYCDIAEVGTNREVIRCACDMKP